MKEEEKNLGKSTSTTVDSTNDEIKLTSPTEGERYYTSVAWQQKIQGIVDSYNGVRHPTKANCNEPQQHTPSTSQLSNSCQNHTPQQLSIRPKQYPQEITTWHFPQNMSQSTING